MTSSGHPETTRQVEFAMATLRGAHLLHGPQCPFSMTLFLHRHLLLSLSCPPALKMLCSHRGFSATGDPAWNARPRTPDRKNSSWTQKANSFPVFKQSFLLYLYSFPNKLQSLSPHSCLWPLTISLTDCCRQVCLYFEIYESLTSTSLAPVHGFC